MENINDYIKLFKEELFESCTPFWLKYGKDDVYGGVYTCVDRFGKLYSHDKSVWMQGRCAYTYSKLCELYGINSEWLKMAKSCIDFLNNYCIDKKDKRMYFTVTEDGRSLRKRRYFFSETFYIMANAEYYLVSSDEKALENARDYYDFVYGMYVNPQSDPYKITPKQVSGTRDTKALANPMILLNVTQIMRNADKNNKEKYNEIAKKLVNDIKVFQRSNGLMLENVGLNGEYYSESASCRVVNPGHSIECSWFLLDEAIYQKDNELAMFAKNVFDKAYSFGTDKDYGGILYFKDMEGLPVEAYEHDMKLWWPHNEAVISSIKFYYYTKDKKYLDIFKNVTEYAFSHFSDREYGEWYGYLRRDGKPTEPPCKGHTYKGPFHVMRMLYTAERILSENNNAENK